MRIGLTGGGRDPDSVVRQAQQAEADGFSSLWYPGAVHDDVAEARETAAREFVVYGTLPNHRRILGDDRSASRARTRALLQELAA